MFGEAFSLVVLDNEFTGLVVRLIFSVVGLELFVLIGGFDAFPKLLSWTVLELELAFLTSFGDRGSVGEV